jgi:L-cystine transport system permease protein
MDFWFMLTALRSGIVRIPATLILAILPLIIGGVFGLLFALARFYNVRVLARILKWVVTVVKGIPVILVLLIFYVTIAAYFDPLMAKLGLPWTFKYVNKGFVMVLAFSLYATVGLSEAFRGGLTSVRSGQFDAAASIGLTRTQTLFRVVLPQAIPVSLPIIGNILISLTQAGAIGSVVAVIDVMNGAVMSATSNYRFLEAYIAAALIYWVLCIVIAWIFKQAERRMSRRFREARI